MPIAPLPPSSLPLLAPQSRLDGGIALGAETPGLGANEGQTAFQSLFEATIGKTNASLADAQTQAQAFAEGKTDDIHGTMIAVSEADIQLRLLGTMKNKIVDAFYELWRMQI